MLKVSRSGYYAWLKSKPSKRVLENQMLEDKIIEIYAKSKQTYGSPRITEELNAANIFVSRPRVARLMKKASIRSIVRKKFIATTDSRHSFPIAENLLNRNFNVDRPGVAWVSDLTYIRTLEGWLYLTVIIDLADRKVIGWSTSSSLKASETILPAWKIAVKNRPIVTPLIFHSDRGVQYACNEFRDVLAEIPLVAQSMSRKGNCWDNAVAESFFKTLKTEWVNHLNFATRKQARLSLFEYIETWFNTRRRHSTLKYKSPYDFSKTFNQQKDAA
jgi:transposase InsO family protein